MIRVSASISRKVPLPGVSYASQGFGGSIEIEVADAVNPAEVKQRLHDLYMTLNAAVSAEIATTQAGATQRPLAPTQAQAQPRQLSSGNGGNGDGQARRAPSGNGKHFPATPAQVKAIFAITKDMGLKMADVLSDHGASAPEQLSLKAASQLIDKLKAVRPARR